MLLHMTTFVNCRLTDLMILTFLIAPCRYGANANSASELVNLTEVAQSQPRTGNASTASGVNASVAPAATGPAAGPGLGTSGHAANASGTRGGSAGHTGGRSYSSRSFACRPATNNGSSVAILHMTDTISATVLTNGGFIVAVDLRTGRVVWLFANPLTATNSTPNCIVGAKFLGPVSVAGPPGATGAGGVVLAPSMDRAGTLFLLNAANGTSLGVFETGATLLSGPSVVGDMVFVGSGYNSSVSGTPGNKLWALRVPAT